MTEVRKNVVQAFIKKILRIIYISFRVAFTKGSNGLLADLLLGLWSECIVSLSLLTSDDLGENEFYESVVEVFR